MGNKAERKKRKEALGRKPPPVYFYWHSTISNAERRQRGSKKHSESNRYWGCRRKRIYPTLDDALIAADEVNEADDYAIEQQAYKCNFCEYFHIGRKPQVKVINPYRNAIEYELFRCELSKREIGCFIMENSRNQDHRKHVIKARWKAAIKKALNKENNGSSEMVA